MDQEELQNLIVNRVKNLQPEIQAVLLGDNYIQKLKSIDDKYKLTPEQASALELNTTLVLIGNTHPDEYTLELTHDLNLAPVVVSQIVADVNSQILKDILGMIKQNFIDDDKEEEALNTRQEAELNPTFNTLPKDLQDAIAKSDYQKKLYGIATKYKLQIEAMGKLEEVTVKFIKGSISPSQYENTLALELGIEASKAHDIATDVNAQILMNIRENMKNQTNTREVKSVPQEEAVPIPPYAAKPKVVTPVVAPVVPVIPQVKIENPTPITPVTNPEPPKIIMKEPEVIVPKEPIAFTNQGLDMMKQKLDGITASKETISDHTLPKVGTGAVIHDPYHEPIE